MRVGSLLCHGRPERSLSYHGYQFPLCARCTGIYLGFIAVLLFELSIGLPDSQFLPLYGLMVLPMAVDGFTQLLGQRESTNRLRLTTGLLAGLGMMLAVRTLRSLFYWPL